MKSKISLVLAFMILSLSGWSQSKSKDEQKPLDSIVKNLEVDKGVVDSYFDINDQKLMLRISKEQLGKDFLMVSRYVKLPSNYNPYINAGSKTSESVIRFEKLANKIVLKQISYVSIAQENDPIYQSVVENNFEPILASFEIKNEENDSYLFDAKDYFSDDSPGFNTVSSTDKKNYGITSVDKSRSWIDSVKSFEQNMEITHTLTFSASKLPRANQTKTLSFQVNHSLIALPEKPMQVRYADPRVGWFTFKKYDYSSEALKSDEIEIIRRWRLEPKDEAAYARGELVEPIKPIVYYLDPATPLKWRPYFKQGIEDWASVFEKAGFKNAILAKDPPTAEEDPEFSPEDVRYSTVRYVASTTRNAVGPSVSDPRTGENLESDIIWYHNHLRSYRNRYLLETGAANPKARTLNTPEAEIGEMMRRVIAHEIGHALGLPHNMKASSAYPVDSLRSGSFTQKMGIATTIMDYARYNYIAQPGDENIRFVRQLGPYDDYVIEWGYRYFPRETSETKKVSLKKMVDEKSMNPIFMFGSGGNDPDTQTENIGDDPIKASTYALKNLKIVAKNLEEWTTSNGQSYADMEELYGELVSVYRRYIYHVIRNLGGVNETLINKGQENTPYKNLNKVKQFDALSFLDEHLWKTQAWLLDPSIIFKIKENGSLEMIQNLQKSALSGILSSKKLNRMLSTNTTLTGEGLSPDELIHSLHSSLFAETILLDDSFLALQIHLVNHLITLYEDEKLNPRIKTTVSAQIKELNSLAKKKMKSGNKLQKNHFEYLYKLSLASSTPK